MLSYEVDGSIKTEIPDIRYNEMSFKNFNVREVNINGEDVGEYHMSFPKINDSKVIGIVKKHVGETAEVLDEGNLLNLEYGSFFKVDPNSLVALDIDGVLNNIDDDITERFKK